MDSIVQQVIQLEKGPKSEDRTLSGQIYSLIRQLNLVQGPGPMTLYTTLLRCILRIPYSKTAQDRLIELFVHLERKNVEITEGVLGTLFTGMSLEQLSKMIEIVMHHDPFHLSTRLYNAVILKCQDIPDRRTALNFTTQLVTAMGRHNVQPNFGTYSNLMAVTAAKNETKAFYLVFYEWRDSETHLSHIGYSELIGNLARFHDCSNGFAVWEELCAVHAPFPLTHVLLNSLLSLCVDAKNLNKAHEILSYFRGQDMELDISAYNLLIRMATVLRCYPLFRSVLDALCGQQESSDPGSTSLQHWSSIFAISKEAPIPDEKTFELLFSACATFTFQESENPVDLYTQFLNRADIRPQVTTFESAIQMFGAWKQSAKQILGILDDLVSRGCSPREVTFVRLISALISIRNRDAFNYTVKELLPKHIKNSDQHVELSNTIVHGCVILRSYDLGIRVATACHMPLPSQLSSK